MEIRFKSFSSGSSGNCYFAGIFEEGRHPVASVLIDAGIGVRRLKQELFTEGLSPDDCKALLVTHDHMDHICSLNAWCRSLRFPVWMPGKLLGALSHRRRTAKYLPLVARPLEAEGWTELPGGHIRVRWFEVPHDATQTAGYLIDLAGHRLAVMTDIGAMTQEALQAAREAETVVLESNYDPQMLREGRYPPELQERIRSGHGHLSNGECAEAIRAFLHPGLRQVFLCHLSENNNTPDLALAESAAALEGSGVVLRALPRRTASPMFVL